MTEPYSPQWWLARLITELGTRQKRYHLLDSYHRSDPPLPPGPTSKQSNQSDPFEVLRRIARVNWADIIVEALIERMKVLGFSTGSEGDTETDAEAWRIWQANDLDSSVPHLLRAKAVMGDAYVIVGPTSERINAPLITCEDPRQVIVETNPTDRRQVLAALKVFGDTTANIDRAYLYLLNPAGGKALLHRATRPRLASATTFEFTDTKWVWEPPQGMTTTAVPVVWFPNRGDLFGRTMGEFEHVLDDLNRISLLVLQRLQIAMLQAFKQRAIKGNLPEVDELGNKIDYDKLFSSDPAALWLLPNGVDMWESSGIDLTPLLESVKADVRELAGRTRTPLYYLFPNEGGSAEGAVTQREGLIFRAASRITETEGPIEAVMMLALETAGKETPPDMESVWQRPDLATLAEQYDAASKALAAGLPERTVWREILQYSPQQIARIEADQATSPPPTVPVAN